MNKWKIPFWCCLTAFIIVAAITFYSVVDQGVTLTYLKEDYATTENDLNRLIDIINRADFTKTGIETELKDHKYYEFMDFRSDTVSLESVLLIFDNNKLKTVVRQE